MQRSDPRPMSTHGSEHAPSLGPLNRLATITGGHIRISGQYHAQLGDAQSKLSVEVVIHDKALMQLALQQGVLGICESYLQGHWECDDLPTLMQILARNRDALDAMNRGWKHQIFQMVARVWYWRRQNSIKGSQRNIADHYDLDVALFRCFLDTQLMYSSALFYSPDDTLEQASEQKMHAIAKALALRNTDHLVEIGTGWGGFALFAATHYGCQVTTTTISAEQYRVACERVEQQGLWHQVTVLKSDYRALEGQYDKLVSIEMIEAVGHQYLDTYFGKIRSLLKPNGQALIQAITIEDTRYQRALKTVDYIKRYIFPGSFIPSNTVMINSAAANGLKLTHCHDMGQSYAQTIAHWRERFNANLETVRSLGFDERFIRMWNMYLAYCEGGFREGVISDVHLGFTNSMPVT